MKRTLNPPHHTRNMGAPQSVGVLSQGVDVLIFANGKFTVKHTAKTQRQSFNAKTCFYSFGQTGVFTLSGGTGEYKGISGSGKFALSVIIGVGPKLKSGACNPNQTPGRSPTIR